VRVTPPVVRIVPAVPSVRVTPPGARKELFFKFKNKKDKHKDKHKDVDWDVDVNIQ